MRNGTAYIIILGTARIGLNIIHTHIKSKLYNKQYHDYVKNVA